MKSITTVVLALFLSACAPLTVLEIAATPALLVVSSSKDSRDLSQCLLRSVEAAEWGGIISSKPIVTQRDLVDEQQVVLRDEGGALQGLFTITGQKTNLRQITVFHSTALYSGSAFSSKNIEILKSAARNCI